MIPVWLRPLLVLILMVGLGTLPARADPRGEEIILKAQANTRPMYEQRTLRVELLKGGTLVNQRLMTFVFLLDAGVEKTLARFTAPKSISGTALLMHDSGRGENQIWSYSPMDRKVRRISGALRQNYFMGTEFSYEDFEGFRIGSRRYDFVGEAACVAGRCLVVDGVETEPALVASSGYSKRRYIIDPVTYYPVQLEFFNGAGRVCKTLSSSKIDRVGTVYVPGEQYMDNVCEGRATRFIRLSIDNTTPINPTQLGQRALADE